MGKSENTLIALEAALERIAQGKPKNIPTTRKLSVRAVEEEAKLGNGSGYYYPEFVQKVKQTKANIAKGDSEYVKSEVDAVREKLNEQKRIKSNFKQKYQEANDKLALIAASQHHLNDQLVKALARIEELEYENAELKSQVVELRRSKVTAIK
jgi:chromosome segregation ATPase